MVLIKILLWTTFYRSTHPNYSKANYTRTTLFFTIIYVTFFSWALKNLNKILNLNSFLFKLYLQSKKINNIWWVDTNKLWQFFYVSNIVPPKPYENIVPRIFHHLDNDLDGYHAVINNYFFFAKTLLLILMGYGQNCGQEFFFPFVIFTIGSITVLEK